MAGFAMPVLRDVEGDVEVVELLRLRVSLSVKEAPKSASCSFAPDSRKSESFGAPESEDSPLRFSRDRAMTGTWGSRARTFSPRENAATTSCLGLPEVPSISCR